jgi:hypothetical protein
MVPHGGILLLFIIIRASLRRARLRKRKVLLVTCPFENKQSSRWTAADSQVLGKVCDGQHSLAASQISNACSFSIMLGHGREANNKKKGMQ